jgi:hypothetical protein
MSDSKTISTTYTYKPEPLKGISAPKENFTPPANCVFPRIENPTEEDANAYRSASSLIKSLADSAMQWKESLPEGYVPAVLAVLHGGIQIQVNNLSQVSFHGIRVQGTYNDSPCTMLAHQSTIQMLCYAQELSPEEPKNPIGFIWEDNEVEV